MYPVFDVLLLMRIYVDIICWPFLQFSLQGEKTSIIFQKRDLFAFTKVNLSLITRSGLCPYRTLVADPSDNLGSPSSSYIFFNPNERPRRTSIILLNTGSQSISLRQQVYLEVEALECEAWRMACKYWNGLVVCPADTCRRTEGEQISKTGIDAADKLNTNSALFTSDDIVCCEIST